MCEQEEGIRIWVVCEQKEGIRIWVACEQEEGIRICANAHDRGEVSWEGGRVRAEGSWKGEPSAQRVAIDQCSTGVKRYRGGRRPLNHTCESRIACREPREAVEW